MLYGKRILKAVISGLLCVNTVIPVFAEDEIIPQDQDVCENTDGVFDEEPAAYGGGTDNAAQEVDIEADNSTEEDQGLVSAEETENQNEISSDAEELSRSAPYFQRVIEHEVVASDDNKYLFSVEYDSDSGISEDAWLEVEEITDPDETVEYQNSAANEANVSVTEISFSASFDIRIMENDEEVQPAEGSNVQVKVEFVDWEEPVDEENVHVVHSGAETQEKMTHSIKETNTIEFEASSFSVYTIIVVDPITPVAMETGTPFYLANSQRGMQFLTNEVISSSSDPTAAIRKTTGMNEAAAYYFESAGNDAYYIYTYVEGVPHYLNLVPYSNQGGNLNLESDINNATAFTASRASDGSYYFSVQKQFNNTTYTYYINKFSEYGGSIFAAWSAANNAGSRIQLIPIESDPFNLDGEDLVIVSADGLAVTSTPQTVGGYGTFRTVRVKKSGDEYYYSENDDFATWHFDAQPDGTYYISTNGQYLNASSPTSTADQSVSLSLSSTPQGFTIDPTTGDGVLILTEDNKTKLYIASNYFRARQRAGNIEANEHLYLGRKLDKGIVYEYEPGSAAGDPGTHTTLTADTFADEWLPGITVDTSLPDEYKSYGEHLWTYTLNHWEDQNGNEYYPGDEIPSFSGSVLILTPVWDCTQSERSMTVEYVSGHGSGMGIPDEDFDLSVDPAEYTLLDIDPEYEYWYDQSTGQKKKFTGWMTNSGVLLQPGDEIMLNDNQHYGTDNETLTLTAQWTTEFSDPWDLDNTAWAILNKQGNKYLSVTAEQAPLASPLGLLPQEVSYDAAENYCSPLDGDDRPQTWVFTARPNGKYYISAGSGQFLNINSQSNVTVSSTPMEITLLYDQNAGRYYLSNGAVLLDYFATNQQIFSAYNNTYSGKNANNQYILAHAGQAVMYTYPPFDDGTTVNDLDEPSSVDQYTDGYVIGQPAIVEYHSEDVDERYTYTFLCWQDDDGNRYDPGDTLTLEEEESIKQLHAVWELSETSDKPVTVTYIIDKEIASEALLNGTSMPVLDGRNNMGYYIPEANEYVVLDLTDDRYYTNNYKVYKFNGWLTENGDVIYPDDQIDLFEIDPDTGTYIYDADHDKRVNLTATWTTTFYDPLELENVKGLIVTSTNIYAMSSTPKTSGSSTGMNNYSVTRVGTTDRYRLANQTGTHSIWAFEPQDDGTYYVTTTVNREKKYLQINTANGQVTLSDVPCTLHIYRDASNLYWFSQESGSSDYLLDFFSSEKMFSDWGRAHTSPANNNKFYIGKPEEGTIVYHYERYDGPDQPANPEFDDFAFSDLIEIWEDGYTLLDPANKTYRIYDEDYIWHYELVGWTDEDDNEYAVGDPLPADDESRTFTPIWQYTGKTERPIVVHYNVVPDPNMPGTRLDPMPGVAGGDTDEVNGVWAEDYTVKPLESNTYTTRKGSAQQDTYTAEFVGWQTESGTVIQPGDEIDLLDPELASVLDPDGNKVVNLTTLWSFSWQDDDEHTSHSYPTVNFYIWRDVSSADSTIDHDGTLPESSANYTPSIASTMMHAVDEYGNIIPANQIPQPQTVNNRHIIVTYVGSTIVQADTKIREMEERYCEDPDNGTRWQFAHLPTDDEVFAALREMVSNGQTVLTDEDHTPIPAEDLTPENFIVRWCYVKYQSGRNDFWHVDGKLTRRLHFTRITKTFDGDPDACEHAVQNGFNITLTDTSGETDTITLSMTDMTSHVSTYGKINDTTYGYIGHSDSKYEWMVTYGENKTLLVEENNYTATIDGTTYGTLVQYNVTNSDDPSEEEMISLDTASLVANTNAYPRDNVDLSNLETLNLSNTYIPVGTLVVETVDDTDKVLPNVEYAVYDMNGNIKKLFKSPDSNTYNVLYENGGLSDVAMTDNTGRIYLKLPEGEYIVKERIPEGYLGYTEYDQFKVTVSADDEFTVEPIAPVYGSIDELSTTSAVYGARVTNITNKADVTLRKIWAPNVAREDSVTFTLYKNNMKVADYILTEEDNWELTLPAMPLVSGNSRNVYTVRETAVGDITASNPVYSYWIISEFPAVYSEEGNVTQRGNEESPYVYTADEILYEIENDKTVNTDIMLRLHKMDADTDEDISNVEFTLYRQSDDQSGASGTPFEFNSTTVYVDTPVHLETNDAGMLIRNMHFNNTYYLCEADAPVPYTPIDAILKIEVDEFGTATVTEQGDTFGYISSVQNGTHLDVEFLNKCDASDLSVTKTVTGNMGSKYRPFTFTVRLVKDQQPYTGIVRAEGTSGLTQVTFDAHGEATFTLSHAQTITIKNLPTGYSYTVIEDDYSADGYVTTSMNATGVIDSQTPENPVSFLNANNVALPTSAHSVRLSAMILMGVYALCCAVYLYRRKRRREL